ncbi:MAG: hypothetical protein ACC658_09385 [Acidimicrobiia bacterium]
MIGRVPKHTALGDDVDPGALFVFIPGALAGGFLISVGLLISDAVRKLRGDAGIERRVKHTGAAVADEVRAGAGASRRTESGLRPRAVYGAVSAISFALVVLVVPGATWNFFNPDGYIQNVGWVWAVSMLAVIGLWVLGVQTLRLAPEWLPGIIAALGLGFSVRFAFGSEPAVNRTVLIVLGLLVAVVGTVLSWRMRGRRDRTDVPPSVRPLLTRTPLSRP